MPIKQIQTSTSTTTMQEMAASEKEMYYSMLRGTLLKIRTTHVFLLLLLLLLFSRVFGNLSSNTGTWFACSVLQCKTTVNNTPKAHDFGDAHPVHEHRTTSSPSTLHSRQLHNNNNNYRGQEKRIFKHHLTLSSPDNTRECGPQCRAVFLKKE